MNKTKFFAALCCTAALFAACEKNEPTNVDNQDKKPDVSVEYTLTVLSADSTLGTVSGSGKYALGSAVKIVASPASNAKFESWSDCSVVDTVRIITLTSDSTITASFKERIIWDETPTGVTTNHGWVDLGLPSGTKWATCNVGATKPSEYGSYFAWGETVSKAEYSTSTYTYSSNPSVLPASADAATAYWGDQWCMPTGDQFYEFRDNVEFYTEENYNGSGVSGLIVKSKVNGNHIFLPAAGYYMNEKNLVIGSQGYYWSSSNVDNLPYRFWFNESTYTFDYYSGFVGYSVRPVIKSASSDDSSTSVMTCAEAVTHLNEQVVVEGYVAFAYTYKDGRQSAWIADDSETTAGVFQAYNCVVEESVSKGDKVRVEGTMITFTKSDGSTIYEINEGIMTKL